MMTRVSFSLFSFPTCSWFVCRQWTFLRDGKSKGVPISPFLDMPAVVIKDKNEEVGTQVRLIRFF